jgi:hypothetical protein
VVVLRPVVDLVAASVVAVPMGIGEPAPIRSFAFSERSQTMFRGSPYQYD